MSREKSDEIRRYAIVDTKDAKGELETSVVPAKWISEDKLVCPRNTKDELQAAKAYLDPDDSWIVMDCVTRKIFNSQEDARKALQRSVETSCLSSEEEEDDKGRGQRKKKDNTRYRDFSNEMEIEMTPKRSRTTSNDDGLMDSFRVSYSDLRAKSIADKKLLVDTLKATSDPRQTRTPAEIIASFNKKKSSTGQKLKLLDDNRNIVTSGSAPKNDPPAAEGTESHGDGRSSSPAHILSPLFNLPRPNRALGSDENSNADVLPGDMGERGIIKLIQSMMIKQEALLLMSKKIDNKMDLVLDYVRTGETARKPVGWPALPLADRNALNEWELFLHNAENYDFAVSHFSVMGTRGSSEGEMAANICKLLFTEDLASTLNWVGSEKKRGLKTTKCGRCIIDACSKQYKGVVQCSKMTGAISTWLRNRSKKIIDQD